MKKNLALMAAAIAMLFLMIGCPAKGPEIGIKSPADNDSLALGNITIKAVATAEQGMKRVEFWIDNTKQDTETTPYAADTFRFIWNASSATLGAHSIVAKAYDEKDKTAQDSIKIFITGGGGGPTYHSGAIDTNETWWPSGNPHIIQDDVYAQNNATLTIKPGCLVKFDSDCELYCGYNSAGAIIAEGTADSTITFTSNVATPARGDWKSVSAYSYAMSTTSFKYCIFECGGKTTGYGAFYVSEANIKFSNCILRKSGNDGIIVASTGQFAQFTNNTVTECNGYAMRINPEYVRTLGAGNTFTNNTNNAILVRSGSVTTTGTWLNQGIPYVIEGDVEVADAANSPVLSILAGTTIKLQSEVEFYVGYSYPGGLIADGTGGWITFTSAIPTPSQGDWKMVSFYDYTIDGSAKLKNCKIEYGGYNDYGNIYIKDALPEITNDSIGHSSAYGIYLDGTIYPDPATLLANNTFYDNASGSVRVPPPK